MGIFSTNQHSQAGRMPMTARFWPPAAGLTVVHLAVVHGSRRDGQIPAVPSVPVGCWLLSATAQPAW